MVTIDQILAEKIASWYIGEWPIGNFFLCVIALVLAVILCGAIGIERERRGRSAGLRTHLLVGVGSCIIMIISIYGFPRIFTVSQENVWERDIARLAAQAIAGVGFLGAGAIIHRNSGTKGLTTAATIWIAMAIGLACGSMNFILATGGTILILVVLTLFKKIERRINKRAPLLLVKVKNNVPIVSLLTKLAKESSCKVEDVQMDVIEDDNIELTFLATSNHINFDIDKFISKIETIEGVSQVLLLNSGK